MVANAASLVNLAVGYLCLRNRQGRYCRAPPTANAPPTGHRAAHAHVWLSALVDPFPAYAAIEIAKAMDESGLAKLISDAGATPLPGAPPPDVDINLDKLDPKARLTGPAAAA